MLWVYEKGKAPRASTPREEAHENYYYTYQDESGTQKTVEEKFAEIESEIAPVFTKLDDRRYFFSPEEKESMAIFLALMFTRVPMGRDFIDRLYASVTREQVLKVAQDESNFNTVYESYCRDEERSPSRAEMEKIRKFALSGKYQVTQESRGWNIAKIFQVALTTAPLLLQLNWRVLHSDSENTFVTSDNPLFTIRREDPAYAVLGCGFGMPGVEAYFPFGPRSCLRMTKLQEEGTALIPGRKVRFINKALMPCARRFLYAQEKSDKLADLFTKNGCKLVYGVNAFAPPPPEFPRQSTDIAPSATELWPTAVR